jgi:Fic family protein
MEKNPENRLADLLIQIARQKEAVDALRPFSAEQEGRIMQKFRLDWNYHSNAIEGNSLTYGETIAFLMEGLTAKGKPFKDHLDIKGHDTAIDFLMHFVKNSIELTEKAIRELHTLLLVAPYTNPAETSEGKIVQKKVNLGAYKLTPNHVKTPTGAIHYFASPEETPAKMMELVDWLHTRQAQNDLHPLLLAATFHHKFAAIHPFDDGNGRMSRLLMNLILLHYGYPPVVIKQQDRKAYYYALRQADGGDMVEFVAYIGENLLRSLELQLKGARGESLEEQDDFDKEIALFKASLQNEDIVPISPSFVYEFVDTVALPLFFKIQSHCRKLDELFEKSADKALCTGKGVPKQFDTTSLARAQRDWKSGQYFNGSAMEITRLSYTYDWITYKKSIQPFSLQYNLYIQFNKNNFEIQFGNPIDMKAVRQPYSTPLSDETLEELSKVFAKEALEYLKKQQ